MKGKKGCSTERDANSSKKRGEERFPAITLRGRIGILLNWLHATVDLQRRERS